MILSEKLAQTIRQRYGDLNLKGEILSPAQIEGYYKTFQEKFRPEVLKSLDGELLLETMFNLSNYDSLVYWLEFKSDDEFPTTKFGSIGGGSALKFKIYKRKETGIWMSGSSQNQIELTVEEAIDYAKKVRNQLVKGCELFDKLPLNGTDEDYRKLQIDMERYLPEIFDTTWAHKYFNLLYPNKLVDFHTEFFHRFNLIKLQQLPPKEGGRYIMAGRFLAIAKELNLLPKTLTNVLGSMHGSPHDYWRIGTSKGEEPRNRWDLMRENKCIAIGWAELGDLSDITSDRKSKEKIREFMIEKYPNTPQVIGRQTQQIFNFINHIKERDLVVPSDGATVLGIGKVTGDYYYEPDSDFPHRRPVEWLYLEEWIMDKPEGLQTAVSQIYKNEINLVNIEKHIFGKEPISLPPPPKGSKISFKLKDIPGRIQSILDRKGQIIVYGPPGTGKTYWAKETANELAARHIFNKPFLEIDDLEKSKIQGDKNNLNGIVRMCCFHPAYGYEDFIEGYRPENINDQMNFILKNGIFKDLCEDALENPSYKYYLIVDEINRGDIPRIFGELMTIIEKDKRGNSIILPLSGEPFRIPKNIFLIGTMNTADRSIALLDTALRRRFGFIELMPDSSVLENMNVNEIPLGPWLDELNDKICEHIGHDARNLQIGHAYLMKDGRPVSDFANLSRIIREDIIPLLEEYCYEDYSVLEKILGKDLVDVTKQRIRDELFDSSRQDDLKQALLIPFPAISTSSSAILSETEEIEDEDKEEIEDVNDALNEGI